MKVPNKENIDNIYKERFDKLELPMTGVEHLWLEIEQVKKKRRFYPYWIFVVGFLALGIGVYSMSPIQSDSNLSSNTHEGIRKYQPINLNEEQSSIASNDNSFANEFHKNLNIEGQAVQIENRDQITLSSQVEVVQKNRKEELPSSNENSKVNFEATLQGTEEEGEIEMSQNISIIDKTISRQADRNGSKGLENTIVPIEFATKYLLLPDPIFLFPTKATLQKLSETEVGIIPRSKEDKATFFFGLNTMALKPFSSLSIKDNTSTVGEELKASVYKQLWEYHFKPVASFGAGVEVGLVLRKGIGVSIGLEYQRAELQFRDERIEIQRTLAFNSNAFILRSTPEDILIGAEVYGQRILRKNILGKVIDQQFNVPVTFSFLFIRSEKISLDLNSSIVFNLRKIVSGRHLTDNLDLVIVNNSNNDTYFTQSLSYDVGMHLGYNISPLFEFYINPRIRYNTSLINSELIKMSATSVGGQVGIRCYITP